MNQGAFGPDDLGDGLPRRPDRFTQKIDFALEVVDFFHDTVVPAAEDLFFEIFYLFTQPFDDQDIVVHQGVDEG